MKKRGVIQLELRWIFMLAAGAAFLLLFAGIAQNQVRAGAAAEAEKASFLIQTLAAADGSVGLTLPEKQRIAYDCATATLLVGGNAAPWPFTSELFMPPSLTGKAMRAASADLRLPFPLSRAVLLVPETTVFAFWRNENSELQREVKRFLPSGAAIDVDASTTHLLFAAIGEGGRVEKAVGVLNSSGELRTGFFRTDKGEWVLEHEAPYFGAHGIAAALAAGNEQRYSCGIQHALARMDAMARSYEQKAAHLAAAQPACSTHYDAARELLGAVKAQGWYGNDAAAQLLESSSALDSINGKLAEDGCEQLY